MKKITLLFMMLAASFGFAQNDLPFDFQGTTYSAVGNDGATFSNGAGMDVLEIVGAVNQPWDNVTIAFTNPIDLSNDAENTLRFTFQSLTAAPGEQHQHGISFQGGGGAAEMNFVTTGTTPVDVELNFGPGITTRNNMVIFTDVKNFGGQSGTGFSVITPGPGDTGGTPTLTGTYIIDNVSLGFDPGTCSDGVLNNGETAIDCGGPNCTPCAADTTPPTGFTAVAGAVGGTSVELLLNATDDLGGTITYDVTYDGGGTAQTTGPSGVETSLVITGLTAETAYTFNVSASDAAGNPAANNAIAVPATTAAIIAFPFTFDGGSTDGFVTGGAGVANVGDQLQITGGVAPWDNVQVDFTDPIDLSNAANNTLRFTMQSTTALPGEVHQHGISFQFAPGGGGGIEVNFQTVGQDLTNVELNFDENLPSDRRKLVIFTDVGNFGGQAATGGQSGMDTNGLSGTYLIDDITFGADPVDSTPPTVFTAVASGTSFPYSVQLLLNATDDSAGTITYDISYNGGANMVQTTGDSGVETAFSVTGLTELTDYTFEVSASDAAGNPAANNAITVMGSTIADTSTPCAGFSTEAAEGSFSVGYNYNFVTETNGDVTIVFEVLDTDKVGLVGEVFIPAGPTIFTPMTNNGSNEFTGTLAGYTDGDIISLFGRFPYAGGLVRTKEFSYTVGDDCSTPANDDCGTATMITLGADQAFDNTGASDSGVATCFTGTVSDIWYSFVAPASGEVTITASAGTQYAIFTDCTTQLNCNVAATTGLINGTTYYLAITDDGTVTRAPGAGTFKVDDTSTLSSDEFALSQFSVFPNPTHNNWTVKGTQDVNTVVVFDILGKQVLSLEPNTKDFVINSEALNSGLYFARIQGATGTKTLKLIKK